MTNTCEEEGMTRKDIRKSCSCKSLNNTMFNIMMMMMIHLIIFAKTIHIIRFGIIEKILTFVGDRNRIKGLISQRTIKK